MADLTRINLGLLRTFHVVAVTGSMTAAAERLFVTQPAISRSIRELESALGASLFSRLGKALELTAEGRCLKETTDQVFRQLETGSLKLSSLGNALHGGTLRLGSTHLVMRYVARESIAAFQASLPAPVHFRLLTENMYELLELVSRKELDAAFLAAPESELSNRQIVPAGVTFLPLVRFRWILAASTKRFADLKGSIVQPAELARLPLAVLKSGTLTRNTLEGYLLQQGVRANIVYECDMMSMVLDLVRLGMGVGSVIDLALAGESKAGRSELFEVRTPMALHPRWLGLAYRTQAQGEEPLRSFIRHCESFLTSPSHS